MHERIDVAGLTEDENDTANRLLKQLDEREPRNLLRSSYYDGKRALRHLSTGTLPASYRTLGLVLGWSAKSVDALARRCHIDAFAWGGGDLDSLGMAELAEENMLLSELSAARTKAFIHGTSFLINTTGADGEPASLIHSKDALNATGVWNHRLRRLESSLSVTQREDDEVTEFVLYFDGLTIPVSGEGGWHVEDRQEHPYGMPVEPVTYRPQSRDFGFSRITRPIMGLQDAGVRTMLRLEGHMEVYSRPEMFVLGAEPDAFKDAQGNTSPSWQSVLGRVRGLPDAADAPTGLERAQLVQFPAATPEPHLKHLNALAKMFAREASLPDSATAIAEMTNPTSAESYDASQYELIAEGEGAIDDFDRPIGRSVRRGLQVLNGLGEQPAEWLSIGVKWRNPKFESRAQAADAGTKIVSAVPGMAETQVGLELMGLTQDQIDRFTAERRRVAGRGLLASLRDRAETDPLSEPADEPGV